MRTKIVVLWAACGFVVLAAAGALAATAPVDLSRPFDVDKDTIALYHLDDVASGEVKDAVGGGKSGKVVGAARPRGSSARP